MFQPELTAMRHSGGGESRHAVLRALRLLAIAQRTPSTSSTPCCFTIMEKGFQCDVRLSPL